MEASSFGFRKCPVSSMTIAVAVLAGIGIIVGAFVVYHRTQGSSEEEDAEAFPLAQYEDGPRFNIEA